MLPMVSRSELKAVPNFSLAVLSACGSSNTVPNAALLGDLFGRVATDCYELQTGLQKIITDRGALAEQQAQRLLHTFYALLTLRINDASDRFCGHQSKFRTIRTLQDLRSRASTLRFLPLSDIIAGLGLLLKDNWDSLTGLGLASRDFHIRQYGHFDRRPPPALLVHLSAVTDRLLMDTAIVGPQKGFARRVSPAELAKLLKPSGSTLFVLSIAGQDVGFFILMTERAEYPGAAKVALKRYEQKFSCTLDADAVGWAPVVGILPEARQWFRGIDIYAYQLLSSALKYTALVSRLQAVFGEVRGEPSANLARKSHLRVGFEPTGVLTRRDRFDYELLRMDLRCTNLMVNGNLPLEKIDKNAAPVASPRVPLPSLQTILEQWEWRNPATITAKEICAANGDRSDVCRAIAADVGNLDYTALENSDGFALQFHCGATHYTVRQVVPNQDFWSCDFVPDKTRIISFKDALAEVRQQCFL